MTITNEVRFERKRERAYEPWDLTHRPEGLDMLFWLLAKRELGAAGMDTTERGGPSRAHHEGNAA
ncbi:MULTISPECIES: DUF2934 domain-containing protein [Methylobacterium]|jgi:hypothetical protein|uniref:DUF2934 domain-containing protein n=1 Tax=Methylobacterium TaxID=407 RepID=UPI0009EA7052|nr:MULTISPECIES: DUF2934 domain-containing protein [unclassified Methylobacterium]